MSMKFKLLVYVTFVCAMLFGFEAVRNGDTVLVSGKRVQLTVKDARIIAVHNLENGTELTTQGGVKMLSAGLGNMTNNEAELKRIHFPWGEPSIKQVQKRQKTKLYGQAGAKTQLNVSQVKDKVNCTWKGLYYGENFAANDEITLVFSQDEQGALVMERHGKGVEGIFGVSVPVDALPPDGSLYLPSFGGLQYDAKADGQELIGLNDTTLFLEAPLMIYVRNSNAFGMWVEDETFRPFFGLIERTPKGSAFTLEGLNLIPYEKLTEVRPPAVKFDIFGNSDWIAAAWPYRNWYQKTFAKEIAIRDDPKSWANDIMVIADGGAAAPGYQKLPELLDKETVLVQIWQARKLGFTTGIPDYTPRDIYPGVVKSVHASGMKVMCYVCSLCAVYKSEAWEKDNIGDFFLTRKNSITNYNGKKNSFDENLVGTVRAAKGKDQFGHLKPGAFLYGDPLSAGWREFFGKRIQDMNQLCGTDANYQDTLGCTADNGNGIIDGLSGSQGNAEMARHMQKVPGVPMASEFGPAPIAFAIRWPLNNTHGWGGFNFRQYRSYHQVPLTAFLFGYRSWISSIRLDNDEKRFCALSVSDSLSGFGMIPTSINPEEKSGFYGQMLTRAQLFSKGRLRPFYPERKYPPNIKAMYQDKDGKIYSLYNDGVLQKMLSPEGKALYARLHGASSLKDKELFLPKHPIWDENGIYGLNPKGHYALVPRGDVQPTAVHTGALPEGVYVKSYYEQPNYAYLELASKEEGKEISVDFQVDSRFKALILNDHETTCGGKVTLSGKLPLKAIFFDGKEMPPTQMIYVNALSGMLEGKAAKLPSPRTIVGKAMYLIPSNKKRLVNAIMKVPSKDSAIELSLVNDQKRFGDGTIVEISVNGKLLHSYDCAKWDKTKGKTENSYIFDNQFRTWTVPVGTFAGQNIFISVAVDWKGGNNADAQLISLPKLVQSQEQEFSEKIVPRVDLRKVRPEGEPLEVIEPVWKAKGKKGKGTILSENFIPLDASKIYYLSGEFKSEDGEPVKVTFGIAEWDAKGQIQGVHVNPIPDSETLINHVAKAGAQSIYVFDASKWTTGAMVALNAAKDGSDLPNRNLIGPITNIKHAGGDYLVTLKKPLDKDIASETPVRCQVPRETFEYVPTVTAKGEWTKAAGRVPVLTKAKRCKVIIITPKPVEFQNIKLEAFQR